MAITPIRPGTAIQPLRPLETAEKSSRAGGSPQGFAGAIGSAVDRIETAEATVRKDAYDLAVGNTDDLHTAMINAAKADITLQAAVQIRNKLLDAYNEIMRINL